MVEYLYLGKNALAIRVQRKHHARQIREEQSALMQANRAIICRLFTVVSCTMTLQYLQRQGKETYFDSSTHF